MRIILTQSRSYVGVPEKVLVNTTIPSDSYKAMFSTTKSKSFIDFHDKASVSFLAIPKKDNCRRLSVKAQNQADNSTSPHIKESTLEQCSSTFVSASKYLSQPKDVDGVRTRDVLMLSDLENLFDKKIKALRISNFYSVEDGAVLAERLKKSPLYGSYTQAGATKIARVGKALSDTSKDIHARKYYNEHAVSWIRQVREEALPFQTPIDKLRLELDEIWPAGAKLGALESGKLFVGLARVFNEGSQARPHMDVLHWDAPESKKALEVKSQVAGNVYLSIADHGGDLILWEKSLTKQEYEKSREDGSYGLSLDNLPKEKTTISPRAGDLILFDSRNVHAVSEIKTGSRVAFACFVGKKDADSALMMWS